MMRPVTSTSVATKGADALAGSNFSFLSTNGSSDPLREPNSTTPTRLTKTVTATRKACGP
jgi:hypothetical protein